MRINIWIYSFTFITPLVVKCCWRGACRETGSVYTSMASYSGQDANGVNISGVDLLLHPELMSQDFMQLVLREVS